MAFHLTPSKRHFDPNNLESNGRGKWQKLGPKRLGQTKQQQQTKLITFRVLCPVSKSGSVIGKGGTIVSKIRNETGAKIKLDETVPGCDERIVAITSSDRDTKPITEQSKIDENEINEEREKGGSEIMEENPEPSRTPSAIRALLLVFERIVAGDEEREGGGNETGERNLGSVSFRFLVLSSQVGSLLGKGGSVIKKIIAETGAQVRIVSRDKLPLCALPQEDVVQITGEMDSVRKALELMVQQMLERPPRENLNLVSGPSSHPAFGSGPTRPDIPRPPFNLPPPHFPMPHPPFSGFRELGPPGQIPVPPEPMTFKLLCMNDKVGSVIGKGGGIVKNIKSDTGSDVKIVELTPESEDRVVIISGLAHPGDRVSPVQNAVLMVQRRLVISGPGGGGADTTSKDLLCRLLISSSQIGCLLGKGGSIIAEMRKQSGAFIRILSKDKDAIPQGLQDNDVVVQINGDLEAIEEALIETTGRLKLHQFRDKIPPINPNPSPNPNPVLPAFGGEIEPPPPPFGPYMGRWEPSPKFSALPPYHERPAPWALQGMPDFPAGPERISGGFYGNDEPPVIPNINVEIAIPRSLVPPLCGEDGGCLRRIREISEAKITITEPRPESAESVILVSGAPDQTHAARSLLEAFILSESGAL